MHRLKRLLIYGFAVVSPPLHGLETPWTAVQDGFSCRIVTDDDYAIGQAVSVRFEIQNRSDRTRYFFNRFDRGSRPFQVSVTGPDGKAFWENDGDDTPARHERWVPLAAGQTHQALIADLSRYFIYDQTTHWVGAFHQPGDYRLRLRYTPPPLRARMKTGTTTSSKGQRTINYEETPAAKRADAWTGTLQPGPITLRLVSATPGFQVHEWGVFTVYNQSSFANTDRKAEWATLPEDFYRQFPIPRLQWVPSAWDKPIIYFHTPRRNLRFRATVRFADGIPVAWWPAAASPIDETPGRRPDKTVVPFFGELSWHGWLGEELPAHLFNRHETGWIRPLLSPLPEKHWLSQARKVKRALPVTVQGTALQGGAPWVAARVETEKFIYYDGLVPAPHYLQCIASDEKSLKVKNTGTNDLGPIYFVDRRDHAARVSVLSHLAKGETHEFNFTADLSVAAAQTHLLQLLQRQGLFPDESNSILSIWKAGLFERPGVTAFYLLPRSEYDHMLPLTVQPRPESVVRVGLVRQPNFEVEPALLKQVETRIAQLDADESSIREQATRSLIDLGPIAIREVKKAMEQAAASKELQLRGKLILDQLDVSDYLPTTR